MRTACAVDPPASAHPRARARTGPRLHLRHLARPQPDVYTSTFASTVTVSPSNQGTVDWYRYVDNVYTFMLRNATLSGGAFVDPLPGRNVHRLHLPPAPARTRSHPFAPTPTPSPTASATPSPAPWRPHLHRHAHVRQERGWAAHPLRATPQARRRRQPFRRRGHQRRRWRCGAVHVGRRLVEQKSWSDGWPLW